MKVIDRKSLKAHVNLASLAGKRAGLGHPSRAGKGTGATSRGSFAGSRKGRR